MPQPSDAFWDDEAKKLAAILYEHLVAAATAGGQLALDGLGSAVAVDFELVDEAVVSWAKQMSLELVKGITETSKQHATNTISAWIESGQPLDDLTAQLEPMFGPTRSELIASTEVTRAFQEGNVAAWRESGVVDGWTFMTAVDELVCPECGPLNGRTYPLDDADHQPPRHPRCRCFSRPQVSVE
jgi:SPP1 gp7 family putative phage head morphogenesis protein